MKKKADAWVSTVLYTLIGLAIIGSLLAMARPKIAETRDAFIIKQTVDSLNVLDDTIMRATAATGMRLSYKIELNYGNLAIDTDKEIISWNLMSNYQYSEANKFVSIGKITALTTPSSGKLWNVTLSMNYTDSNINMTIDGQDKMLVLSPAQLAYNIWITNNGVYRQGETAYQKIDLSIK